MQTLHAVMLIMALIKPSGEITLKSASMTSLADCRNVVAAIERDFFILQELDNSLSNDLVVPRTKLLKVACHTVFVGDLT